MRVLADSERSAELGSDLVDVLLRGLYAGLGRGGVSEAGRMGRGGVSEAGRMGLREGSQCGVLYPCPLIPSPGRPWGPD